MKLNELERIKVNGTMISRIQIYKDEQLKTSLYMEPIRRAYYRIIELDKKGTVLHTSKYKGKYSEAVEELYRLGERALRN